MRTKFWTSPKDDSIVCSTVRENVDQEEVAVTCYETEIRIRGIRTFLNNKCRPNGFPNKAPSCVALNIDRSFFFFFSFVLLFKQKASVFDVNRSFWAGEVSIKRTS